MHAENVSLSGGRIDEGFPTVGAFVWSLTGVEAFVSGKFKHVNLTI